MLKHNKKRNVGLLLEFFSRYIAQATIDKNNVKADKALGILNEFFSSKTQISKELKVFNALNESKLKNKETAYSLMKKVKSFYKKETNVDSLHKEKTRLIHEINKNLGESFFDQDIPEYKNFANVQLLLNCWRSDKLNEIKETAKLEDKILGNIIEGKEPKKPSEFLNYTDEEIDNLVVGMMHKKLNEKYGTTLDDKQKEILRLYVFANEGISNRTHLLACLEDLQNTTLKLLDEELSIQENSPKSDRLLKENLFKTKEALKETKVTMSNIDDDSIMFFMNVAKVHEELKGK